MLKSITALLPDSCKPESPNNGTRGAAWKQQLANWGAFAAATGAALAMSTNASASIIYGTPDLTVSDTPGPPYAPFKVGGAGGILADIHDTGMVFAALAAMSASHLNFKGRSSTPPSAFRYAFGQPILAAGPVNRIAILWGKFTGESTNYLGQFGPGASKGFVGFSSASGDLGWLQVQVTLDEGNNPIQLELISWAYNDVAGAPINAGQTTATPEPGTEGLALLALGAAGILALRKRRNAFAAK